jgi:hypothetical protein
VASSAAAHIDDLCPLIRCDERVRLRRATPFPPTALFGPSMISAFRPLSDAKRGPIEPAP